MTDLDLTNALVAYGDHRENCEYGPALRCTCGWLDVVRKLAQTGADGAFEPAVRPESSERAKEPERD